MPSGWNPQQVRLLNTGIPSNSVTHSGLIYYLHACWAKELGCVLRPDMVYYTIVSEIATYVVDNPEKFRSLFSNSKSKVDFIVSNKNAHQGDLNINDLC
jgi:hypothetical protein